MLVESSLSEEQLSVLKQKTAKIERLETDITNLSKPLLLGDGAKDKDWVKHVTPGVLSIFQDDSSWNKLTLKPGDQLSKQQQQQRQNSQELQKATGSSWKKVKEVLNAEVSDGDDSMSESEPATTKLNYRDMKTYGNLPMQDEMAVVNCDSCQRPILASSFKKHLDTCGKKGNGNKAANRKNAISGDYIKKKTSNHNFFSDNDDGEEGDNGDDDDDDDDDDHMGTSKQNTKETIPVKKKKKLVKGNNINTADGDVTHTINNNTSINNGSSSNNVENEHTGTISETNAKRPPPNTAEKSDKKKIKKEKTKTKGTKQKAPLDLDKQCGVIQQPNGLPCTRSLTCKSHSMGAKRAVAGRSQPYDVLLAAYQKKAIGRPQAGAMGGLVGKNAKSKKPSSPAPGGGTHPMSSGSINNMNTNNNINNSSNTTPFSSTSAGTMAGTGGANNEDYFDSDEEVENVMQALRSNHPTPLAQKPYFYVKRQRQCFRLRDILLEAITPKVKSVDSNPTSIQANGNPASLSSTAAPSLSGPSVTTSLPTSHSDSAFYNKAYPFQDGSGGIMARNINLQQQQQISSSTTSASSSPISGTIGYPGIYSSSSMDGLSPISPTTSSVVSSYSIR